MASASSSAAAARLRPLSDLVLETRVLDALPLDAVRENSIRQVPNACFSLVDPTPIDNPQLVAWSRDCFESVLGLQVPEQVAGFPGTADKVLHAPDEETSAFIEAFVGNRLLPGSRTASHCYCGHQFGYFSGQLGDGAAIYLGDVVNPSTQERQEVQLKGAGLTPYSRTADGRKVLRSSLREFMASEHLHALGVPTTRAATIITSDLRIERDPQYSGRVVQERSTVVARVAPSFIRMGSFQIAWPRDPMTQRAGPSEGNPDVVRKLLDFTVESYFPRAVETGESAEARYQAFFREVVESTARLVADWQLVGFCHGVLNTDNMSILGLTIDYGPYGFMEHHDPSYICNGSDHSGRYAYDKQPEICRWNCEKLAEALDPIISADKLKPLLEHFDTAYAAHRRAKMRRKLGLLHAGEEDDAGDDELFDALFALLAKTGADHTNAFRRLADVARGSTEEALEYIVSQCCSADFVLQKAAPSIPPAQLQMLAIMAQENPAKVYQLGISPDRLVFEIEKANKYQELAASGLTNESKKVADREQWSEWLQRYRERLDRDAADVDERVRVMNASNPAYVLRNWIAQQAIEAAQAGDYAGVQRVMDVMCSPFEEHAEVNAKWRYDQPQPEEMDLCVTCSS